MGVTSNVIVGSNISISCPNAEIDRRLMEGIPDPVIGSEIRRNLDVTAGSYGRAIQGIRREIITYEALGCGTMERYVYKGVCDGSLGKSYQDAWTVGALTLWKLSEQSLIFKT